MKKQKLAMVIDAASCLDCKACLVSCRVANQVPLGHSRNWIKAEDLDALPLRSGFRYQPGGCMQCDLPTCVAACPTGATYKDPADGTVKIDRSMCIGCGQCVPACPYGARYRHPELRIADKCDFCHDRRQAGLEPACVSTCPTKARIFGDLLDPESEAARRLASGRITRVVRPGADTQPNLYYVGSPGPETWLVEPKLPTAMALWKTVAAPAMKAVIGLTGLGVLAMLVKQLVMPKDPPVGPGHGPEPDQGGPHA